MHLRAGDLVRAVHSINLEAQGVVIPVNTTGMIEKVDRRGSRDLMVAWEAVQDHRATTVSCSVESWQVSPVR